MNTNKLALSVEICSEINPRTVDEILMNDCALICIQVDELFLLKESFYEDGLVVFDELFNTLKGDGNYLIFTCACGVADDGGWDTVKVTHLDNKVNWVVCRGGNYLAYSFNSSQYSDAIYKLSAQVEEYKNIGVKFEPENPVFPE